MEEQVKTYYISLDKRTVSEVSVPDTVEYEVRATPSQIVKFENILQDNDAKEFEFAIKNIPFKPFAEKEVDEMREESDDNVMAAYHFIYQYGTEETRKKIKEIGSTK
ncbi:MAG TPA: hypothetical protein VK121_00470 [Pseudogracilibacillus sp.]|nr:hypothetical protein [Pseudogracilibacillus sp.]